MIFGLWGTFCGQSELLRLSSRSLGEGQGWWSVFSYCLGSSQTLLDLGTQYLNMMQDFQDKTWSSCSKNLRCIITRGFSEIWVSSFVQIWILSYSLLLCEGVTSFEEVPFDFRLNSLAFSETPFQLRDMVDEFSWAIYFKGFFKRISGSKIFQDSGNGM